MLPKDSVPIASAIRINNVVQDLAYADKAIMSNPAVGYGVAVVTVYDSAGAIALDANDVALSSVQMNWDDAGKQAALTISAGMKTAGVYEAHVLYGVLDSNGDLDWRRQRVETFTVSALKNSPTYPDSIS